MLMALVSLAACSMKELSNDIARAHSEYNFIKVVPHAEASPDSTVLLGLYSLTDGAQQLINVRSVTAGAEAIFLVPLGHYRIIAFEDSHGDFVYSPGEPVALLDDVEVKAPPRIEDGSRYIKEIEAYQLKLVTQPSFSFEADLSLGSITELIETYDNRFLELSNWSDERFSMEKIKLGMWQPLTFLEEIGFGLYLTEPLDTSREQIIYVHGINGSPAQFESLASALGSKYQTLLFHYPSGLSLDYSAYMLRTGISELAVRYPNLKIHIIAHSMGGLVTRGAIVRGDKRSNQALHSFVSISTPWAGHEAARSGVTWSPTVAPVWRGMVPYSDYQTEIFGLPIPANIQHHLIFSYAQQRDGDGKSNDGVVTLKSQLFDRAQDGSRSIRGFADSHNGVLKNAKVAEWINSNLGNK